MSVLSDLFTDIAGAIRGKTGEEGTLKPIDFPSKIESISVGGGGSSELVGYVTFMNGDVELYKMPFIKNFDCSDPVSKGLIETPTKESTLSTVYTFNGWDNDLTDLSEDVIVNATYEESTRYYTVTFYDDDGTTVLNTIQVTYGETPTIADPEKYGVTFDCWIPELSAITGDTSYQAQWIQQLSFNDTPWTDIQAAVNNDTVLEQWSIGDTKTITLTWEDGTTSQIELELSIYDSVSLLDSKKRMVIVSKTLLPQTIAKVTSAKKSYAGDSTNVNADVIYPFLNETLKSALPNGMADVLTTICIPTVQNLGYLRRESYVKYDENNTYAYQHLYGFDKTNTSRIKCLPDGTPFKWWVDDYTTISAANNSVNGRSTAVNADGSMSDAQAYGTSYALGVLPVFIINQGT